MATNGPDYADLNRRLADYRIALEHFIAMAAIPDPVELPSGRGAAYSEAEWERFDAEMIERGAPPYHTREALDRIRIEAGDRWVDAKRDLNLYEDQAWRKLPGESSALIEIAVDWSHEIVRSVLISWGFTNAIATHDDGRVEYRLAHWSAFPIEHQGTRAASPGAVPPGRIEALKRAAGLLKIGLQAEGTDDPPTPPAILKPDDRIFVRSDRQALEVLGFKPDSNDTLDRMIESREISYKRSKNRRGPHALRHNDPAGHRDAKIRARQMGLIVPD